MTARLYPAVFSKGEPVEMSRRGISGPRSQSSFERKWVSSLSHSEGYVTPEPAIEPVPAARQHVPDDHGCDHDQQDGGNSAADAQARVTASRGQDRHHVRGNQAAVGIRRAAFFRDVPTLDLGLDAAASVPVGTIMPHASSSAPSRSSRPSSRSRSNGPGSDNSPVLSGEKPKRL